MVRSTHTYVTLGVSAAAHAEVTRKLKAAGYDHVFDGDEIDMHGLALVPEERSSEVTEADWATLRHLYTNDPLVGMAIDYYLTADSSDPQTKQFEEKLLRKAPANEGDHG